MPFPPVSIRREIHNGIHRVINIFVHRKQGLWKKGIQIIHKPGEDGDGVPKKAPLRLQLSTKISTSLSTISTHPAKGA
jgi:hypothetical protein